MTSKTPNHILVLRSPLDAPPEKIRLGQIAASNRTWPSMPHGGGQLLLPAGDRGCSSPVPPSPRSDAVRRRRGSTRAHGAPRRRCGPSRSDGSPGILLRSGPLSGGGGGARSMVVPPSPRWRTGSPNCFLAVGSCPNPPTTMSRLGQFPWSTDANRLLFLTIIMGCRRCHCVTLSFTRSSPAPAPEVSNQK
jgi:hypothetical protein